MRAPSLHLRLALCLPAALATLAGPASALSCMAPDPAASYTRAAQAEERYVVAEGRLSYDAASLPEVTTPMQAPVVRHTTGQFSGRALSAEGFDIPFAVEIAMDFTCAGPWCAGNLAEGDALVFLQQTDDGYTLEVGPCGGWHFEAPSAAQLDVVRQCHVDQTCG